MVMSDADQKILEQMHAMSSGGMCVLVRPGERPLLAFDVSGTETELSETIGEALYTIYSMVDQILESGRVSTRFGADVIASGKRQFDEWLEAGAKSAGEIRVLRRDPLND
jgi:hypothetical protein